MSLPTTVRRTAQRRASDPSASAWVDASAGTGKTKLLTDRVLRLLLAGSPPERILCLTFTRAAAAEMSKRIVKQLGDWAVMKDAALDLALADLDGEQPDNETRMRARQLFARIVDAPAGFRIQTIHAFCQSVLRRFPFEANIPPHFDLIDDRTRDEMLGEAQRDLLVEAGLHPDRQLGRALAVLVEHMTEFGFAELMQVVVASRTRLAFALADAGGAGLLIPLMWRRLGLEPGTTAAGILDEACRDGVVDCIALREAAAVLAAGSATDRKRAEGISIWIAAENRPAGWAAYISQFLTAKGEPSGAYARTTAHKAMAHILDGEAERLAAVCDRLNAAATGRATEALLWVADALLSHYADAKQTRAVLDYDDLVEQTSRLLHDAGAAWVLFKLDGGVDHILVDEAQDTNPAQWRIVQALAEEFFAGKGAREQDRTIFIVGDEKQSIFSFQGSDPAMLGQMRYHFADRVKVAQKIMEPVDLANSYRSTQPVLSLVDSVFAGGLARDGVLSDTAVTLKHGVTRVGHAGLVELWPPIVPVEEGEAAEPSELPTNPVHADEPETRLAYQIADTIAGWIANGEQLGAEGRPITAGDVMILVRRRTRFVDPMVRALKARGVTVAGVDRLALTEPLAVRDLIALGRFLLLPEDDLNLAALLKTPLIGLDEERLFALAHERKAGLWAALIAAAENDPAFEPARAWLAALLGEVDYLRPFELYSRVLVSPCPGDPGQDGSGRRALWGRLGPDALDPLEEFLSAAVDYERRHPPTLEGFIGWLDGSTAEIKREMATRGDSVRIVTVHGAKGLEAPIVILPDTMQLPRAASGPTLLWHENTENGRALPFWSPRADLRPRFCTALAEAARLKVEQEYRRLLYVALTRARDRLYVCGWQGKRSPGQGHWYGLVEAGMSAAGAIEIERNGQVILRIEQPQTAEVGAPIANADLWPLLPLPAWARQPAPPEPRPSRPLAPSRLEAPGDAAEPPARSPASADDARRFRRGRAMHLLLQHLPDLPADVRARGSERLLAGFTADEQAALLAEALAVIEDPSCAAFFGPSSRAEVPIVGRVGTRGVAGQIDRLLVEPECITIVDFKTGRAPMESRQAPAPYLAQMAAYRAVLRQIYPGREIACVLIWTDGLLAMPLDPATLDPFETYLTSTAAA